MEYFSKMIETNYVGTCFFFKRMNQLKEEDIFLESNVNTFNTCLRLTNEVKFYENNAYNDMNKKVKQLIKD